MAEQVHPFARSRTGRMKFVFASTAGASRYDPMPEAHTNRAHATMHAVDDYVVRHLFSGRRNVCE